jgi:uncharacterized protein (TIGR04255 family)
MAKYKTSPILEAICESQFKPDSPWDPTIIGLFYENIKQDYPKKEVVSQAQFQIHAGPEGISNSVQNIAPLMRFIGEKGSQFIHIGANKLSIHVMAPYPQWTTFYPMIENALTAYNKVAST